MKAKKRLVHDSGRNQHLVSKEEFHKLNASKHAVEVSSKLGEGFMALPEFVHQIHCVVRLLRIKRLIGKHWALHAENVVGANLSRLLYHSA